jgi:hypothetical protein
MRDGEGRPPVDYKALVQDDRIHASLYTDMRIFADEIERIFHRGWVFVGPSSWSAAGTVTCRSSSTAVGTAAR